RDIVPADSVTLARLEGWVDLVAGRTERARGRLASIADRDPLAAIGMVRLAAKDAGGQAEADETAAKLLGNSRTGLVGAIVWSARQQTTQFIRIDQGALADTLEQNPSASAQINGSVLINPQPVSGGIGPGPAGQRKALTKALVRSGFPLAQPAARRRLIAGI